MGFEEGREKVEEKEDVAKEIGNEDETETEETKEEETKEELEEEIVEDELEEKPEKPEETPEIPEANLQGENRRLKEQIAKLKKQNADKGAEEQPFVPSEPILSPFLPTDESDKANEYWQQRESETGLDRKVIYNQEKVAYNTFTRLDRAKNSADLAMSQNIDTLIETHPEMEEIRDAIVARIRKDLSHDSRRSYNAIEFVAKNVAYDLLKNRPQKPPEKKGVLPKTRTTVMPSKPISSKGEAKTITKEMINFAEQREIIKKGERITPEDEERIYNLYYKKFPKEKK